MDRETLEDIARICAAFVLVAVALAAIVIIGAVTFNTVRTAMAL